MSDKWKGHALVLLQVTGIVTTLLAYSLANNPHRIFLWISVAGFLLGLLTLRHNRPGNFSVYPTPLSHSNLITTGPYMYMRHPMYSSVILVLLGLALAAFAPLGWLGFAMGMLAVIGKSYLEETYLTAKHPAYAAYKQRVKRLIPFVW